MNMIVSPSSKGYQLVLLEGDLDTAATQQIDTALHAIMEKDGNILIDLRKVGHISGRGLRMLMTEIQAHAGHGGKTVLLGVDDHTRRLLKATGMDHLVPVRDDAGEAASTF